MRGVAHKRVGEPPLTSLSEGPDGSLVLLGPMGYDTVAELRGRADPVLDAHLRRGARVTLDLSGVTRTDSAGLALLVHLARRARARAARLELRNVPDQMIAIARTVGLEGYLVGPGGGSPAEQ